MSIITITSDLGTKNLQIPTIKGMISSLDNTINIVDISHDIESYNLKETAFILKNTYNHFPKGSVHLVLVDCLYRKDQKYLIFHIDGHYFLSANNGLMSLIFRDIKPEIFEINIERILNEDTSLSAIDFFVPVAVHLVKGGLAQIVGNKTQNTIQLTDTKVSYDEKHKIMVGQVIFVDHFGNLISNIDARFFNKIKVKFTSFEIKFRYHALNIIHQYQTEIVKNWEEESVFHGKAIATFNEIGLLEIALYKGFRNNGATGLLRMNVGDSICIEFKP